MYNIIVFDSRLCSDTITCTIQPADSLSVVTEAKDLKCYNDNSGAIEVISITNGTAPYVYNWSGPNGYTSALEDITSLEAGVYVLSLTDSNLCSIVDDSTIVLEPDTISISSTILQPSCNTNDGSISVVATGGGGDANPPNTYTYSWADLGAGPGVIGNVALLDNIGAGLYEVTVTDDSLCVGSKEINISDINGPIVTDSTVDVTCNNDIDGKIFLTVTTQPLGNTYGIDWDIDNFIGATPPDLDGLQDSIVQTDLPAGVYFVRVTDSSNNCLTVHDATVNDPGPIVLAPLSSDSASCNGLATGSASVGGITGVTGGNGGYNYTWANALTPLVDLGQNNDTAFNLIAGDYNIKVEDIKGCSD